MKLRLLHRGDHMWVFLEHKKRLSGGRTHDCPSEYDHPSLSKRAACLSTRKLCCGTLFAEGGAHFFLLSARRRVVALTKILLFGASPIMPG